MRRSSLPPLLLLALAACADSPSAECSPACVIGEVCVNGGCRRADAGPNPPCPDGGCAPGACRRDDDCPGGRCVDGECFADACADGEIRVCTTACGEGQMRCSDGVWRPCNARQPLPVEVCGDGRDDDCDGQVDEDCTGCEDGATRPCASECGPGVETCVMDTWQTCDAPRPGVERCDEGGDEDCDGRVDEDCGACAAGDTRPCATDCGQGEEICAEGAFAGCDAPAPDAEGRCPGELPACGLEVRKPTGDVRASSPGGRGWFPRLLWTGVEYGVFFGDRRGDESTVQLARVSAQGRRASVETVTRRNFGDAAWTGDGYLVVSVVAGRLRITRVSALGRPLGETPDLDLTRSGLDSAVAWRDGELGLAWSENLEDVYFARIAPDGRVLSGPDRLTNAPGRSMGLSLIADPQGYALAFRDERDAPDDPFRGRIYFLRLDAAGRKRATERAVTTGKAVSLARAGDGYALAVVDARGGGTDDVYFVRLDAAGERVGPDVPVSESPGNAREPALAAHGAGFGVVWADGRHEGGSELWFAALDARGARLEAIRLTDAPGASQHPALLWHDGRFALAWSDGREAAADGADIFFAGGPLACE